MHRNTYTHAHNMLVHMYTYCTQACTHTHTYKLASTCMRALSCLTVYNSMDCSPPGSSGHGIFLGKNTGVGCHFLLQGIFLTQGSNPGIPHCRWILYSLIHLGSPIRSDQSLSRVRLFVTPRTAAHQALLSMEILQSRILEWVAMLSSRGSSQPSD